MISEGLVGAAGGSVGRGVVVGSCVGKGAGVTANAGTASIPAAGAAACVTGVQALSSARVSKNERMIADFIRMVQLYSNRQFDSFCECFAHMLG